MRRKLRFFSFAIVIALAMLMTAASNHAVAADTRLFGTIGTGGTGGTSTLVELDPSTGALIQTIGPIGYIVNGLDYDPVSGKMYATTSATDPVFANGLLTIDPSTGEGTPVGAENLDYDAVNNIRADPAGNLLAWDGYYRLLRVDPNTGLASTIADLGRLVYTHGASFDANGTFYLIDGAPEYRGNIYIVDPLTGELANTGRSIAAIAHHGDFHPLTNKYWGIDATGAGAKNLRVVDVATGTVEQSLPTVDDLHTIAFMPPRTITTTFAAGVGQNGNMFDIHALKDLTISHFDIHCLNLGTAAVEVYYKAGTYKGAEYAPEAWTLLGSAQVSCSDFGTPTPLPVGGLVIPAGETYGLYITRTDGGGLAYTYAPAADTVYDNEDLSLTFGLGRSYPFGFVFSPRIWNGTIYYYLGGTAIYTVTPSAGPGGSISPAEPQAVLANQTASFTLTPETGYHIDSVDGCGGTLVGDTYTTGPVIADCDISATFAIDTFTVTPSAGPGGSISPATPQTLDYNQMTSFTVTPSLYYLLGSVTGCGGTLVGNSYTTAPITADCTVAASFVPWPTAGTPSSLSASPRYPSRNDFVNLSWGASATAGVTYELERSVYGGSFVRVYQGPLTTFREKVYTLPKGPIVYRVRAVKDIHLPSPWRTASAIIVR